MKIYRKATAACIMFTALATFAGYAQQQEKVLRVYSGGEVILEQKITEIDYVEIVDLTTEEPPVANAINGHEFVDLGLPSGLKWSVCNMGASAPEEIGAFYAWGETEPKEEYSRSNSTSYDVQIDDFSGNPEYDAARANWGGTWRLPTKVEMDELRTLCTWSWTTQNDVQGYVVTGPNGNTIFFPANGSRNGTESYGKGQGGHYWSSTPGTTNQKAYYLYFYSSARRTDNNSRSDGRGIRAVSN